MIFIIFFQLFLEELAEKEKMARKLNEPSMYVDYLDDDLKLNSVTGEHNTVIKIGKKVHIVFLSIIIAFLLQLFLFLFLLLFLFLFLDEGSQKRYQWIISSRPISLFATTFHKR